MIVVLENHEYSSVIGNPEARYLNGLADHYGLATRSYGYTHPSLPNYLMLISGTTFGITSDCTDCTVDGQTIVDQIRAAGIGWRAYMEDAPGPCPSVASSPDGYVKRHDPFVYVTHIANDPVLCNNVVPYDRLSRDLSSGQVPPFAWITPNVCNDAHSCNLATADRWLAANLPPVFASSWFKDRGAMILTFDEGDSDLGCCNGAQGGHIATIVVSGKTPPGSRSDKPVDPAGVLATMEDLLGLGHLADAAKPSSGNLDPLLGRP